MIDINRKTSYDALVKVEIEGSYSNIELNYLIEKNKADNPSFVRDLTYGVIKYKYLLDYYIDFFAKKIELKDRIVLRMGVYQYLFMNSVPKYAAINETVELAKKVRYGKTNFINGVLRNFDRKFETIPKPNEPWINYSIEKWIYDLLSSQYTDIDSILEASNRTPELCIRVNQKKTNTDNLINMLVKKGYNCSNSNLSNRAIFIKGSNLLSTSEFKCGLFSVQDESSILCTDILLEGYNEQDELIIDTCAAPGGKSLSIKEKISDSSKLISCDIYDAKLDLINNSIKRLGLKNIDTIKNDSRNYLPQYFEKCDRVLCDVPCSGLGVLRRKPEIKYKKDLNLDELYSLQYEILTSSINYLKKDGILVYSTCTINKRENEEQIKKFLESNNEFILEKEVKLLPKDTSDGFYIARLKRCR